MIHKFLVALKRSRRNTWLPIFIVLAMVIPNVLLMRNKIIMPDKIDECSGRSFSLSGIKDLDVENPEALKDGRQTFQCFLHNKLRFLTEDWAREMSRLEPRGVIMSAGTPYSLTNAFINLYTLRHHLKSELPFVIMYWGDNKEDCPTETTIKFFETWISNTTFVDLSLPAYPAYHRSLQRDGDFNGWKVKIFALYSAPFKEVLYLDSDNLPLFNPDVLFNDQDYKLHGSMFWPDIYCGSPKLHELLGMPASEAAQTESGQYIFDRERHWMVLEWLLWLNTRDEIVYSEAYGDKDTFKAAFFLANRLEEFYQVPHPLGLGLYDVSKKGDYPVRGFVHFAPNGSALFMHRVSSHKYDPHTVEKKPVSFISLPSCGYFKSQGWNPIHVPSEHAKHPPFDHSSDCLYNMHNLHESAWRCAYYDTKQDDGSQPVPVFKVPSGSYVQSMLIHSDKTFDLIVRNRHKIPGLF